MGNLPFTNAKEISQENLKDILDDTCITADNSETTQRFRRLFNEIYSLRWGGENYDLDDDLPLAQQFIIEGIEDPEMQAMKIISETLDSLNSTRSKAAGVRVLNYALSRYQEDALDIISLGDM